MVPCTQAKYYFRRASKGSTRTIVGSLVAAIDKGKMRWQVSLPYKRNCRGSVDLRPQNLNREVPGSNLLAAAVVPLCKEVYPNCLVPQKGLEAFGLLVACFLSGQVE